MTKTRINLNGKEENKEIEYTALQLILKNNYVFSFCTKQLVYFLVYVVNLQSDEDDLMLSKAHNKTSKVSLFKLDQCPQ